MDLNLAPRFHTQLKKKETINNIYLYPNILIIFLVDQKNYKITKPIPILNTLNTKKLWNFFFNLEF